MHAPRLPQMLLLAGWLALPGVAFAGTVAGDIGFLGEVVPALRIHAWQPATGQRLVFTTRHQQTRYTLPLPAGRWILFARPDEPGAPDLYGAYTRFAACSRNPRSLRAGACSDHTLLELTVWKNGRVEGIDLTDWYLDDATSARLDQVLGRAKGESTTESALAAPRFSEYPATLLPPGTAATTSGSEANEARLARDQAAIAAALAKGPNFAGSLALMTVPGGLALLDLRTGQVRWPTALAEPPGTTPCVDGSQGAVLYRRDSRLLTVTRQEGEQLVTRYLVWDDGRSRLEEVASLSSALPERCRNKTTP